MRPVKPIINFINYVKTRVNRITILKNQRYLFYFNNKTIARFFDNVNTKIFFKKTAKCRIKLGIDFKIQRHNFIR